MRFGLNLPNMGVCGRPQVLADLAADAEQASAIVRPYAEAGASWWLEAVWRFFYAAPGEVDGMLARIRQGPPRLS
jgi:hypothetical protein